MTGDTVGGSTRQILEASGRPFIAKPFGQGDLATLVRVALEQSRGPVSG
jgi:hypothetical protein